jgi:hypothetical protein
MIKPMEGGFSMKTSMKLFVIIALVMVIGFLTGCTTTNLKSNLGGEYNMIPIARKDFTILGLVNVTATENLIVAPLHLSRDITGERVTFDLLLQEAKRLYPDVSDIINVRIDRIDNSRTSLFHFFTGYNKTVQYLGNAIAVKYTTAVDSNGPGESRTLGGGYSGVSGRGFFGFLNGFFGN